MTKCIVKSCRSSAGHDGGVTLHGFPGSLDLIKLWLRQTGNVFPDLDALARNVLYSRSGRYQICSKHFSPKCYVFNGTKMVLRPDAVPTVFQAQSAAKAPVCQKRQDEVEPCLHTAPPKPHVETPPLPPPPRKPQSGRLHTEEHEDPGIKGMTPSSAITATTTDKSVGTDPYNDLIESKIEKLLNKRLLNLAMEIISMLTGEEYLMVKKNSSSPSAKREVPVKCGDVSVHFSMEEWDYIEDHKDSYRQAMAEAEQRRNSCSPPAEAAEPIPQRAQDVISTEKNDDDQSKEDVIQVDVSTNTCDNEFSCGLNNQETEFGTVSKNQETESDTVSRNPAQEESCLMSYCENASDQDEADTDECKSSDYGEGPYIMTCSPGDMVEDDKPIIQNSQAEDEADEECFPVESPRQEMEDLAYSSTSGQCEESAWSDYERFAGEPSYASAEPNYISGKPSYSSAEPSYASAEPSYASVEPSYASGEPSYASSEPDYALAEPSYASGEPSHASGEPSHALGEPSYASGKPNYKPGEPLQIKEESNQFHYGEEPTFIDPTPIQPSEERSQLFDTMNNLLIHQITFGQSSSSADKPYPCNHCEKRFAKRSHLAMHLKTHSGDRPYSCPDCGKQFSRRSNMLTHYRTHTGEKPFACPKCGKRFTQSSHMVTHQKTHSGDKLFTCPECRKCFTKWSYLNFHLRTHGIEKLNVT